MRRERHSSVSSRAERNDQHRHVFDRIRPCRAALSCLHCTSRASAMGGDETRAIQAEITRRMLYGRENER